MESVALSETEALTNRVIDLIAPSTAALLEAVDGRAVEVGEERATIETRRAVLTRVEMNWRDRFLTTLTNPNIAYILFMLGLLGLYFELSNPGAVLPGTVGAISLILAFFAFQTLPVNYAGILLIILAVVLFILEVLTPTFGALTIGGLIAMFIGSVMLFESPHTTLRVSTQVILPVVLVTGALFILGAWLSIRALRRRPTTGEAGLIGQEGEARTAVTGAGGSVFVAGAHWRAVAAAEIPAGARVRVKGSRGMTLEVEAVESGGNKTGGV
jgi:membrane-bound serine protease (ClpP class)